VSPAQHVVSSQAASQHHKNYCGGKTAQREREKLKIAIARRFEKVKTENQNSN
jgi:hypothetical protein